MDPAPNPVPSYLATAARAALAGLAGYLIKKGLITADNAPEVIAGGLALVTIAWGFYRNWNAHAALKDAIAAPAGKAA